MNEQPHEVKYVTMMGSAAHNYGNVLAIFQKWLLDKFPDKTFKTIHVQSKLAHRQMISTPHEFIKKTKPIIVFNPRIDYNDSRFLDGTLLTERHTELYNRNTQSELLPFFQDNKNRIGIKYALNRYMMYVDVNMIFNSMMQQTNYMQMIKNAFRINIPFDIFAHLESYLGKDMMSFLSSLSGIPLKDDTEGIKPFMDYLNGNSVFPCTYKLQGSTGTDEYYRYYDADIIATITDLNAETSEKQGFVTMSSAITMTIKLEWYGTGFYYLFSDEIHDVPKPIMPPDSNLVPIYTDVILEEDLNLPVGWQLFTHTNCMLTQVRDKLDFSVLLNSSIKQAIAYHLKNGMPMNEFIDIKVRRQGDLLDIGRHYKIDMDNLTILFNNKSYGFYTYTILISVNLLYINNLIKDVFHLK